MLIPLQIGWINSSQLTSNSDDLKNTLSFTSTVLNRVNCLRAPDCGSLNRLNCSLTEGTCGECLLGYLGVSGPSNTKCIALKDLNRRLSSSATSTPHNCSSDSDCNDSGLFLECNHASQNLYRI
jgi:hypothetical protein